MLFFFGWGYLVNPFFLSLDYICQKIVSNYFVFNGRKIEVTEQKMYQKKTIVDDDNVNKSKIKLESEKFFFGGGVKKTP